VVFVGTPKAYRGLFLIDMNGTVQHQVVNKFPLGRSVQEVLRMVDALQFNETHGEVCPADWHPGQEAMKPTQAGLAGYLKTVKARTAAPGPRAVPARSALVRSADSRGFAGHSIPEFRFDALRTGAVRGPTEAGCARVGCSLLDLRSEE
jgi:hypothetical protein